MKNLRLPLLFLALSLMGLLAACGNKGDLVRPGEANPPAQR
ncbi:LPS translocon maturation chaperone LptM [Arenimonas sp.]